MEYADIVTVSHDCDSLAIERGDLNTEPSLPETEVETR